MDSPAHTTWRARLFDLCAQLNQSSAPIALREDLTGWRYGVWRKRRGIEIKAGASWRLPRFTTPARVGRAARIGGIDLQTIRDWVLRFNAGGEEGLVDAPGRSPKLNGTQRQELARIIESGPIPATHGVVRWRLIDLAQWVWEEYRIRIAKQTLSRRLRAMGFRKLSARPRHRAHNQHAAETSKKTSPTCWRRSRAGRPRAKIEVWFQDEARIGQKNKITRRWARRGTRPHALNDQRTSSTYLFGASYPKEGTGAGLVLPFRNSATMALHLADLAGGTRCSCCPAHGSGRLA